MATSCNGNCNAYANIYKSGTNNKSDGIIGINGCESSTARCTHCGSQCSGGTVNGNTYCDGCQSTCSSFCSNGCTSCTTSCSSSCTGCSSECSTTCTGCGEQCQAAATSGFPSLHVGCDECAMHCSIVCMSLSVSSCSGCGSSCVSSTSSLTKEGVDINGM